MRNEKEGIYIMKMTIQNDVAKKSFKDIEYGEVFEHPDHGLFLKIDIDSDVKYLKGNALSLETFRLWSINEAEILVIKEAILNVRK